MLAFPWYQNNVLYLDIKICIYRGIKDPYLKIPSLRSLSNKRKNKSKNIKHKK